MTEKPREPDEIWEVLPAGEMRRKYGLTAENRPTIKLDPQRVPEALRVLIPWAEEFGISDDLIRDDVFAIASKEKLAVLRKALVPFEDALDEWLAGAESDGPSFSKEYIAFSAMRMGVDCITPEHSAISNVGMDSSPLFDESAFFDVDQREDKAG